MILNISVALLSIAGRHNGHDPTDPDELERIRKKKQNPDLRHLTWGVTVDRSNEEIEKERAAFEQYGAALKRRTVLKKMNRGEIPGRLGGQDGDKGLEGLAEADLEDMNRLEMAFGGAGGLPQEQPNGKIVSMRIILLSAD